MKKKFLLDGMSVVIGGLLFLMVLIVVALLFPNWFVSAPSINQQDASMLSVSPIVNDIPVRMIPIATVQPTPRVNGNGKGITSLQKTPQINFQGIVQQITEQPQSDGQLHVWINLPDGTERRISVAPGWFLQYLGCPLQHDITISGSGFIFQQEIGNNLVYARKIVVNGKTCNLRNDEGFALWSNKLR
ncbi:putative Magnetosome protein MamS [Gammaproteobacteria bacterium]